MHGSGFRDTARRSMEKAGREGKMTVTEEQLKAVFEIGAASEGTTLEEVSFSERSGDLYVHEQFREVDSTPFEERFWFKATLITPYGVRTIDVERSPEHWPW